MPDIHVPNFDDHGDDSQPAPVVGTARRKRSLPKIVLEVLLIGGGVFLGLLGEQWREYAHHHKMARESLRQFRTEISKNRAAIAAVSDYHVTLKKELTAFLSSEGPKSSKTFDVKFHGIGPVFYEQTAWDLALATQALAYVDADLAFALSRAYTFQRHIAAQQFAIVQSTLYGRSWTQDFEGYWRQIDAYMGDITILEPRLLKAYDEVLSQLDLALGPSTDVRPGRK